MSSWRARGALSRTWSLPVVATVVALGVAGCGGDDAGADDEGYVKAWSGLCQRLTNDVTDLTADLSQAREKLPAKALKDPEGSADLIAKHSKGPLLRYVRSVEEAYGTLEDLDAPERFADFHAKAVAALPALRREMTKAEGQVERGQIIEVTTTYAQAILKFHERAPVPAAIRDSAPGCESLGKG
ncbi:MAG: hypothetical protein M0P31_02945 [Solirubrobacteraceae bacterium]|nr:hypothetical protein [Solirubrobacteraceae bacterium]